MIVAVKKLSVCYPQLAKAFSFVHNEMVLQFISDIMKIAREENAGSVSHWCDMMLTYLASASPSDCCKPHVSMLTPAQYRRGRNLSTHSRAH